jgi:hypothetical protein
VQASCPNGTTVVSGGVTVASENIGPSGPFGNGGAVAVQKSWPVGDGVSWDVDLVSPTEDGATHVDATVYVVCAS